MIDWSLIWACGAIGSIGLGIFINNVLTHKRQNLREDKQ